MPARPSAANARDFLPVQGDKLPRLATKRILIVEDNELNQKLLRDVLEAYGYATITTTEGVASLALARENRPDLILMDLQLPDISGLDAVRGLRDDDETRIAPQLKRLAYEAALTHWPRGDQRNPEFPGVTPQGLVPALEIGGHPLTQSWAIVEYLAETHPEPPLLPRDAAGRARVRALAAIVACDIHPLNNLRVLRYLHGPLAHDEKAIERWYNHWITNGFAAFEQLLAADPRTGTFCHGETPGVADIALVPQVYNAHRYPLDLTGYPTIMRVYQNCKALDAFAAADPDRQPDREP